MATIINADPWTNQDIFKGVPNQSPAEERNPILDITFYCGNNNGAGFFKGTDSFSHETEGVDYDAKMTGVDSISGSGIVGNVIVDTLLTGVDIIKTISPDYPVFHMPKGSEWVKWSDKDGFFTTSLTTTNKANVKGEMPMEFSDILYQAKKLGQGVAIYGKNGIAIMMPTGVFMGLKTLYKIGLKSKNAVCGTDDWHCCLDREGILWEITSDANFTPHDYSNHLSAMNSATVLSYDQRKRLVYICDGVRGYVWSKAGLGKCPINITGMGYNAGTFYVVGPAAIANSALEIWSDIWDGGSRDDKEVFSTALGADVSVDLYGAIAYRWDKASAFYTTPWVKADRGGIVNVSASGIEFKFGFKLASYTYMRVDRMEVEIEWSELKPLGIGE